MGTTDTKSNLAEIPSDDGSIATAISHLDTLITDWTAAVAHAQSVLQNVVDLDVRRQGTPSGDAPQAGTKHAPAAKRGQASDAADQGTQTRCESPAASTAGPKVTPAGPPAQNAHPPSSAEDGGSFASRLKRLISPAGESETGTRQDGAPGRDARPPSAGQSHMTAATDDDEALLASLDPKTANAIRIKRRLSNGNKSVRQLLEES